MNSTALAAAPALHSRPQPSPVAEPSRPGKRQLLVVLSLALPTALLLYCCFFPFDCGWLAWGALVPLLLLARSRMRPLAIYSMVYVAALAFFIPVLQWMRVADDAMYYAWPLMAAYCSLYFPLALYFIRYLDRRTRLPLAVTAPIVWTALEYFRSEFLTGFSWYLIGHTQHDYLGVIQIADLAGVAGVTFLVVMVNGLLAEVLLLNQAIRKFISVADGPLRYGRSFMLIQIGLVLSLLVAAGCYGMYRLRQNEFRYGPRIALIQGNLDQRVRNDPKLAIQGAQHFGDICTLAARSPELDLIVWPETSFPTGWAESSPGAPAESSVRDAVEIGKIWEQPVLLGLKSIVANGTGKPAEYNSALLLVKGEPIDRYDKIHLVPFGEYVPFRNTFPLMKKLTPYDFDYSVDPGTKNTRFPLKDQYGDQQYSFGVVICYEDTVPDVSRPYGGSDGQAPVDFLLNTSNDGWFNGTSEHEQHLAISRFRAIEGRCSLARSVNMGISALIDPNGRVLRPVELHAAESPPRPDRQPFVVHHWVVSDKCWGQDLPVSEWGKFKKVAGVLEVVIPIDNRKSFYARAGDWLPWSCWCAVAVGMFAGMIRRLRPI